MQQAPLQGIQSSSSTALAQPQSLVPQAFPSPIAPTEETENFEVSFNHSWNSIEFFVYSLAVSTHI